MFDKHKRLDQDIKIIKYKGIFRRELSVFQAVALIVSGTIGAGVLSIPYAVSKVGLRIGILYIVLLGSLMMGLNLLIGYVTTRTEKDFQIVGLAKKYLGRVGEVLMAGIVYFMLTGALLVYFIGEGEVLAALFGGSEMMWRLIFLAVAGLFIIIGMRGIKTAEFVMSLAILGVILVIAFLASPYIEMQNTGYINLANFLLPYGVILFAFHGATSIPESHMLLKGRDGGFKRAIIIAGLISIAAYVLFAWVVVGVSGTETTEIATLGLGQKVGEIMYIFGNVFAVIAMGSSFLMIGMSLKDSFVWDYKMPSWLANGLVLGLPPAIFFLGLKKFIGVIDIVGGVFISLEMIILILIYWRAKQVGDLPEGKYKLHHTLLLAVVLLFVFIGGAIYSVVKLF